MLRFLPAKNLDRTSESGIVSHVLRKAYAGSMIFQPIPIYQRVSIEIKFMEVK